MVAKRRDKYARCSQCGDLTKLRNGKFVFHANLRSGAGCATSLLKPQPGDERVTRDTEVTPQESKAPAESEKRRFRPPRANCRVCKEEHQLIQGKLMSIHLDRSGRKCSGSAGKNDIQRLLRDHTLKSRLGQSGRHVKTQRSKTDSSGAKLTKEQRKRKLQIDKAVTDAIESKWARKVKPKSKTADKSIYAVNGIRVVSGGSPSLGKRR